MYATISREIALSYVTNSNDGNNSSMETVLFEIELDETVESFVNIQNVSFLEQDGEYLFLIGTIFQLESCRMLPSTIWHIKLKLTNREEDEAKQLINHFENLFDEKFTVFTLGMFWLETSLIEKYDNALNYYNMLLNEYTTDNAKISIYTNIALIYDRKGDKDKINTRNYYEEALALAKDHESLSPEPDTQTEILEVILKRPVLNSTSLSIYYYNLGCIMFEKKNFENALENFEKANKQFSVEKLDPIVQADILNNIGCVYFRRNEYEISMRYFEQAFDIGLKIPEENRSAVITDYLSNMSAATIKQ
ncbi:unnamed protein product [Didymodactylos carnosus]|nr:unnamed protein product [Didymodactylos carnosus]CAF3994143.1 unnamed protein product [Didymodactylos carnosus]